MTDTERIDWLNADHDRVEEVFGAMVRNDHGGDIRAIIDAEAADEVRRTTPCPNPRCRYDSLHDGACWDEDDAEAP